MTASILTFAGGMAVGIAVGAIAGLVLALIYAYVAAWFAGVFYYVDPRDRHFTGKDRHERD
jgi:hypothetical protein